MSREEYYEISTHVWNKILRVTTGDRIFLRKPLKCVFYKMNNYENIFISTDIFINILFFIELFL